MAGPRHAGAVDPEALERTVEAAVERHLEKAAKAGSGPSPNGNGNGSHPASQTIFRSPATTRPIVQRAPDEDDDDEDGGCGQPEKPPPGSPAGVGMTEMERMIAAVEERVLHEIERRGGRFAEVP